MNSTNTITGNLWPSTRNPETATPTTNTNHHYPDSLPQFRPFAIPVAPSEPVASYSATYTAASLHTALRSYRQRRLNIEKLKHAGADTSQHEQQLERLLSGILAVPNPANQQCLIDRYIRGEPVITIAVRLGVTEKTVYNRLSAGRAELLRILS